MTIDVDDDKFWEKFDARLVAKLDEKLDARFAEQDRKWEKRLDIRFAQQDQRLFRHMDLMQSNLRKEIAASEKRLEASIKRAVSESEGRMTDQMLSIANTLQTHLDVHATQLEDHDRRIKRLEGSRLQAAA